MFVDTSAWVALVVQADQYHGAAKAVLDAVDTTNPLFTTDYVVDETLTRVRRVAGHRVAARAGELLRSSSVAQIRRLTDDDVERAWSIFRKHADQDLSFTDCTSVAFMERTKLRSVFTFDEDFRRLGYVVVPRIEDKKR